MRPSSVLDVTVTTMSAQGHAHPGDDRRTWRAPQVCSLAGCSYRQLDYWARLGMLEPSIESAHGQGSMRRYSSLDVAAACVLADLSAVVRVGTMRPLIAALQHLPLTDWRDRLVVCVDAAIVLVDVHDLPSMAARASSSFWLVNLGAVVDDLRERMLNLAA